MRPIPHSPFFAPFVIFVAKNIPRARPIGHWQHWNWQHFHIGNILHSHCPLVTLEMATFPHWQHFHCPAPALIREREVLRTNLSPTMPRPRASLRSAWPRAKHSLTVGARTGRARRNCFAHAKDYSNDHTIHRPWWGEPSRRAVGGRAALCRSVSHLIREPLKVPPQEQRRTLSSQCSRRY